MGYDSSKDVDIDNNTLTLTLYYDNGSMMFIIVNNIHIAVFLSRLNSMVSLQQTLWTWL